MEEDTEEELEPTVKYSYIIQEEEYEDEDEPQPWDPNDIFFRIQ